MERFKRGYNNPETGLYFLCYYKYKGIEKEYWVTPEKYQRFLERNRSWIQRNAETERAKRAERWKRWYSKNKERRAKYLAEYQDKNKEKLAVATKRRKLANPQKYKEREKEQKRKRKDQNAMRQKERYASEPNYRLARLMRCALWRMAKFGWKRKAKSNVLIGCSYPELRTHLEKQFSPEMNWNNHASYWEIDHIRPLASFDLSNEEEQKKAWHFTNLQPLTIEANRRKWHKYEPSITANIK